MNLKLTLIFFLLTWNITFSQGKFIFETGVEKDKISFELINNLVIIPVELNGLRLSFLLDTGVETTILLGINDQDSLDLGHAEKIKLRGIGGDDFVEALKSENNHFKIGKTRNEDMAIYVIFDRKINFSPRLGFPVHGIIGYDFFKDFIVEINYKREFIRIYEPGAEPKKIKRYDAVPLVFYKNKPYVNSIIQIEENAVQGTLLVDSGLADALWLFEDDRYITIPEKSYEDFIGLGLVGDIYGKRSKIPSISISGHKLREINVSYPDTSAFGGLKFFIGRNGSIGSEILRRFHLIFNYQERKLYLRKNNDFHDPFLTNMSGITVEHSGFKIIESFARLPSFTREEQWDGVEILSGSPRISKTFSLKPGFRIVRLRKNSPAENAGLLVGDEILSINGREFYKLDLEKISSLFSSEVGEKIEMKVKRNDMEMIFAFNLEKVF